MIGPLGFAGKNLSRRGFHSLLAFLGLAFTVASTTFLLLLGQDLAVRLGIFLSPKGTFGIDWLFFGYLLISLTLVIVVGTVSVHYLVSSMIKQRMRDIGVLKAAGCLPGRLFMYVFGEGLLVAVSSCLVGGITALLVYLSWSWPMPRLFIQVGPVPNAGWIILMVVPLTSFILSTLAAGSQVRKIIKSSTAGAVSAQLSGLNLRSLGNPVQIKRLGSAFNLASRTVSRDRDLNRTLTRVGLCIFLTVVVLTGALVSADTTKSYVERAMPADVLVIAHGAIYNQYIQLGTVFSNPVAIPALNYTDPSYIISPQIVVSFAGINGVERVDTRLITMSTVNGYIKAHLSTNETSGNYYNVYIPEVNLGSTQALLVGVNATTVIGDWYTSNGFLQSTDPENTMVTGDSLLGSITQTPFNLSQVSALGSRYDVKGALVDPLNGGRVLYAPVQPLQTALGVNGYNVLLVKTNNDPTTIKNVEQLVASSGLVAGPLDTLRNANLSFLTNTWSYFLILPILGLALTCGILLSYLTTTFSRRFNDYLVLRILGAKAWYSLRLLLWEAWGLLAVCMVIAVPLAWLVSIFFLLPEASFSIADLGFSAFASIGTLSLVSVVSALVYSRRLTTMTVKDLRS